MSRRTFDDMDAELLLRLSNRTDITAAMRAHFLNDALLSLALRFNHPEIELTTTQSLIQAASSIALPTGCWWLTLVQDATAGKIVDLDSKRRIESNTLVSGPPSRFYRYGTSIYFDHLSDVTRSVKLWYLRKPTELIAGAYSSLDEVYDLPIIMLAHVVGLQTVRDLAQAAVAEVQLQNYLASKRLPAYEEQKNDGGQGITVRRQ